MLIEKMAEAGLNRPRSLQNTVSKPAAGIAAQAGIEMVLAPRLEAQAGLTPDGALQELMAGNSRFAANELTSVEHG